MTYEETVWVNNDVPLVDFQNVAIFKDKYPAIEGHLLFVRKQTTNECIAEAYKKALDWADVKMQTEGIEGVNIGQNIGAAAGQSVMWPHIHFIPRQYGDSPSNEANGIRLSHPKGTHLYKISS